MNRFDYDLRNTLNASLGPCLVTACAPGADGVLGTGPGDPAAADDPGIPNQTSFFAGRLLRAGGARGGELLQGAVELGLPGPLNVAVGGAVRREQFKIVEGEFASWVNGNHLAQDSSGPGLRAARRSSAGSAPSDASDHSRTNCGRLRRSRVRTSPPRLLANVAGRFENYSDFGSNAVGQARPALPAQPAGWSSAAPPAPASAPRAWRRATSATSPPATSPASWSRSATIPTDHPASKLLGAKPLKEETSFNLSGGLAFTPRDNLTLTLDVFHIKINDRILLGATFDDDTTLAILAPMRLHRRRRRAVLHQRARHQDPGHRPRRQSAGSRRRDRAR